MIGNSANEFRPDHSSNKRIEKMERQLELIKSENQKLDRRIEKLENETTTSNENRVCIKKYLNFEIYRVLGLDPHPKPIVFWMPHSV